MANITQIYDLVNNITSQVLGETAVAVVDTTSLVALGDTILSSSDNVDAWNGALVDRIGKTIVSNTHYTATRRKIYRAGIEYGIIMQKIYTDLPKATGNETWQNVESKRKNPFELNLPTVRQYLFSDGSAFEYPITITDEAMKTAFTNATAMGAFVESIMSALYSAMELSIEETQNLAIATFISHKFNAKTENPLGCVNLLAEYKAVNPTTTVTVENCLFDKDFLKFASRYINLTTKRMSKLTTIYNISEEVNGEHVKRATSKNDLCLDILTDFSTATASYLEADTFHKELVALPNYYEVPYWQGSGESYDFEETSAVKIKHGDITVEQSGIIAVAYDVNAIGTTMDKRRTATVRNERGGYTNHFEQATLRYFNDLTENGVVFYVAD